MDHPQSTPHPQSTIEKTSLNPTMFFFQIRIAQKGTCHILLGPPLHPPKTPNHFFRKQETPFWGHTARRCTPQKRQTIFSGNKKPRFGDIMCADLAPFGPFWRHGLIFENMIFHIFTP
jgi:hypothetical protein